MERRLGAQVANQPGSWNFSEATVDPGIKARQSVLAVPPGFEDAIAWTATTAPDKPPRWHVSFTVADRDRTVAEAEWLVAKVLGQTDTAWRQTALIRDPQGAVFTASEFTPPAG